MATARKNANRARSLRSRLRLALTPAAVHWALSGQDHGQDQADRPGPTTKRRRSRTGRTRCAWTDPFAALGVGARARADPTAEEHQRCDCTQYATAQNAVHPARAPAISQRSSERIKSLQRLRSLRAASDKIDTTSQRAASCKNTTRSTHTLCKKGIANAKTCS